MTSGRKDKLEEPRHLLDLIRFVRPKAALFTTYTFSVSHFDAVFLPVLRSVGCQEIAVLVDADEVANGTLDSQSRAAGRVYRVVPVIAPGGGVFHPKLAYLTSESHDVLAVGSGNLTASGQSLQLESFDAVSAADAPSVFVELASWMELLASSIHRTSFQASHLLTHAAHCAQKAHQTKVEPRSLQLPPPTLIHTLSGTARESLEAVFIAEADSAEAVTVLSPFHAPDGGPLLRLSASVEAKQISVGLDGGCRQLTAPFDEVRFKPMLATRFVVADTARNNKRLHAKVFELQAADKVLVMTGSINATAQSFESTKNVEVSLARWLPTSPFNWKAAEPVGYESTQEGMEFSRGHGLYVDAWLATDRMLHGRIVARVRVPPEMTIEISSQDAVVYQAVVSVDNEGGFVVGPTPKFDTSASTILTVADGEMSATCWLNVLEELELAEDQRERRAAISRVMRGEYEPEDVAEILRLLNLAAASIAGGHAIGPKRLDNESKTEPEVEFSFMRWETSGRNRGQNTFLGRNPYELLNALVRWLNSDLTSPAPVDIDLGTSKGAIHNVQLLGGTETEQEAGMTRIDPFALLDQLCQVIPVALERQPEAEYGALLAEVVASRAVDRAFKQGLGVAPCVSWLDRFSRFAYAENARQELVAVASAMSCFISHRLSSNGQDSQLSMLKEAVERFAGAPLSSAMWSTLASDGLQRELYRRIPDTERVGILAMHHDLFAADTLDDSVFAFLHQFSTGASPASKNTASLFPEAVAALGGRRRGKLQLRGLLDQRSLDRGSCPFCYLKLNPTEVTALRQKHVTVHRTPTCSELLFFSEQHEQFAERIKELCDA